MPCFFEQFKPNFGNGPHETVVGLLPATPSNTSICALNRVSGVATIR